MIKIKNFHLTKKITESEIVAAFSELNKKIEIKKNEFLNHFNLKISLIEIETCRFHDYKNIVNFNVTSLLFKDFKFTLSLEPLSINKTNKKRSKLVIKLKDDLSFTIAGSNNINLTESLSFINSVFSNNQSIINYINSTFRDLILEYITLFLFAMDYSEKKQSRLQNIYKQNHVDQNQLLKYFNFFKEYMKLDPKNIINVPFFSNYKYSIFQKVSFCYKNGKYFDPYNINPALLNEEEFFTVLKNSFYFNNQFYFDIFQPDYMCSFENKLTQNVYEMSNQLTQNAFAILDLEKKHKNNNNFTEIYFLNNEINNF